MHIDWLAGRHNLACTYGEMIKNDTETARLATLEMMGMFLDSSETPTELVNTMFDLNQEESTLIMGECPQQWLDMMDPMGEPEPKSMMMMMGYPEPEPELMTMMMMGYPEPEPESEPNSMEDEK